MTLMYAVEFIVVGTIVFLVCCATLIALFDLFTFNGHRRSVDQVTCPVEITTPEPPPENSCTYCGLYRPSNHGICRGCGIDY